MSQKWPVTYLLPLLTTARGAGVAGDAGQGVVELVDQLHLAHAHVEDLLQAVVDLLLRALRHVRALLAVEQRGDLDAEHDGEPAGVDGLARLGGVRRRGASPRRAAVCAST
jgi:hypothetical protein